MTATIANGPGHVGDWVALYAVGGTTYLDWRYLNATQTMPTTGVADGTVAFTMPTTPGSYVVQFSCQTVLATSPPITVAGIGFTVSATTAVPLGTVTATVANGPGHVDDVVGLCAAGGSIAVDWQYLNRTQTPPATGLTAATIPFTMPITPGLYTLRLSSSTLLLATSSHDCGGLAHECGDAHGWGDGGGDARHGHGDNRQRPGPCDGLGGAYPTGGTTYLDWQYLNGSRTAPAVGVASATVTFAMPLTAGSYRLLFSYGTTILAMSDAITVTSPALSIGATVAAPSSTVTVGVANAPGGASDWVGLYATGVRHIWTGSI